MGNREAALLAAGHRVITYDRRGFGASSRPSIGYDFDTLAADLHVLLSRLDLRGVVLAGFAMGAGEVVRYLAVYGSEHVRAAVLVAPVLPFLLKTANSPEGIDRRVFDGITARITADRPAAMKAFMDRCYNIDLLGGSRVSDQAWQNSFYVAISASAHAALSCVAACLEDFRGDLATISIPVLVIHGDQDLQALPYEATSRRLSALLKNARSVIIAGGPHAIIWTHAGTRSTRHSSTSLPPEPGPQESQRAGELAAERIPERLADHESGSRGAEPRPLPGLGGTALRPKSGPLRRRARSSIRWRGASDACSGGEGPVVSRRNLDVGDQRHAGERPSRPTRRTARTAHIGPPPHQIGDARCRLGPASGSGLLRRIPAREPRSSSDPVQAFADCAESHSAPGFTRSGWIASICQ